MENKEEWKVIAEAPEFAVSTKGRVKRINKETEVAESVLKASMKNKELLAFTDKYLYKMLSE